MCDGDVISSKDLTCPLCFYSFLSFSFRLHAYVSYLYITTLALSPSLLGLYLSILFACIFSLFLSPNSSRSLVRPTILKKKNGQKIEREKAVRIGQYLFFSYTRIIDRVIVYMGCACYHHHYYHHYTIAFGLN